MKTKTQRSLADVMQHEHEKLATYVVNLRQLLEGEFDWLELDRVLTEFDRCLRAHFAFEETGGYMTEVLRRLPGTTATIETLKREHEQMTADLREVRYLVVDRENPCQVREKLLAILKLLRTHEATENLLVQEAFNTEFGVGD